MHKYAESARVSIDQDKKEVEAAKNFTKESLNEATKKVDDQLRDTASPLYEQIKINKSDIVARLEQFRDVTLAEVQGQLNTDLAEMKKGIQKVRQTLTDNEAKVNADQAELLTLATPLASLHSSAQQSEALAQAVSSIRADETAARTAAQGSANFSEAASRDAATAKAAAATAQASAERLLASMQKELDEDEQVVGDLKRRFDEARSRLADVEDVLKRAAVHQQPKPAQSPPSN
jgi:chromosome segregation ATPase